MERPREYKIYMAKPAQTMVTVVLFNKRYPAVCRLCPTDCELSVEGADIFSYYTDCEKISNTRKDQAILYKNQLFGVF